MKKQLLALGMIATSMGFAQNGSEPTMHTSSNGQCNTCCSTPCCCKPCCVPKPPKCIDCECYVPQHYDMSCDCGWFVSVDFLYFYGRESLLPYANASTALPAVSPFVDAPGFVFGANKLQYVDGSWDPGVRVGLGWKGECDGWDLSFFWTWYKNCSSDSVSGTPKAAGDSYAVGDTVLNSYWIQDEGFGGYTKFSGKWEFKFNSFDLEFGRRYWLSKCFDLRPYFGLRGAWGETDFKTSGSGLLLSTFSSVNPTNNVNSYVDFENDNWGVGFLGGIQPVWHFSDCFSFYSNFDMSLIWGRRKVTSSSNTVFTLDDGTIVTSLPRSGCGENYGMQTALDLGLGFRYENCYCDNQYRFALDLGWEHHVWLNYNERYVNEPTAGAVSLASEVSVYSPGDLTSHDVMFGGFVLRARFDF